MRNFHAKISLPLLIFILAGALAVPMHATAQSSATLTLSPSGNNIQVNDAFSVDVQLNTQQPVTSVKTYVTYDPTQLYITSFETQNSEFPYWWEQSFRPETSMGRINIQVSSPTPGVSGIGASIARINFRAIGMGAARLAYDSNSLALNSADQNILDVAGSSGAIITIGQGVSSGNSILSSPTFYRNLDMGDRGADVKALQQFLNNVGFQLAQQGPGSPGNETEYFGSITKAAVVRFQEAYASEVLAPFDITKGTGFFGTKSREKAQEIVSK
jgi:hypothetical protein